MPTLPAGSYSSKEEALVSFREDYDAVKDEHAVYCADTGYWIHSDDAHQCFGCGQSFWDGLEINPDGLCIDCWEEN